MGSILGASIEIHFSLFILIAWLGLSELFAEQVRFSEVVFMLAVLGSITLHEISHLLIAKLYKIRTREIVLYPFGGLAKLEKNPAPKAEVFIAAAGPLTNFLIAIALVPFTNLSLASLFTGDLSASSRLIAVNLSLGLINLLPALPMDGGRLLRSLLGLGGFRNASTISARVSQLIGIIFGILSFVLASPLFLVAAIFIFTNAVKDQFMEMGKRAAIGKTAVDGMTPKIHLQVLVHGMTVSSALPVAVKSFQTYFPVLYGDEILGLAEKDALIRYAAVESQDAYIAEIMDRDFPSTGPNTPLADCLETIENYGGLPLVIIENKVFLGMLFKERVIEYLVVSDLRARPKPTDLSPEELL